VAIEVGVAARDEVDGDRVELRARDPCGPVLEAIDDVGSAPDADDQHLGAVAQHVRHGQDMVMEHVEPCSVGVTSYRNAPAVPSW